MRKRVGFFIVVLLFVLGAAYVSQAPTKALHVVVPFVQELASTEPIATLLNKEPTPTFMNPLAHLTLYVEPDTPPARQALLWQTDRPLDAQKMTFLAQQPRAVWFGTWNTDVTADVKRIVDDSVRTNTTSVLVAYDVPSFSCEAYEQNKDAVTEQYLAWIQKFAAGIGTRQAIVILEPDALAGRECLSTAGDNLIGRAVLLLKNNTNALVYIDAGHAMWNNIKTMAAKLTRAHIAQADGFALNVSNFITTEDLMYYGTQLSRQVGGKHFVLDTSRNGNGPTDDYQWCNPPGRAIGALPTVNTGRKLADAFLWIKQPGESDGTCNGGPEAGTWWPEYALSLVDNANQN